MKTGCKWRGTGREGKKTDLVLTVYLIERGEGGHVGAVNVMDGDGRKRTGAEL